MPEVKKMDYKEFQTPLSDNNFQEPFDSYDYYVTQGMKEYEQGFKEDSHEEDRRND